MGTIRILDETVAGRIAAGEVVERPSSIIKELVENSIDAGATSISIAITDGGIRSIRVADNGDGISREDMPLTIIKHATSKLSDFSDLETLYTMGFRGEALFSISAVSMLKITSRRKQDEVGTELIVHGGRTVSMNDVGAPEGTSVLVENLFFNIPARLKFLKKPSLEAAAITDLVAKLIISHPEISIRYTSNGNVIYHSSGNNDLRDCISLVYGREAAKLLIPFSGSLGGIDIEGYIGQPELSYKSKKNGTVFVNSRYIKSELVEAAIMRGYGERFLKGTFPFYCIKISMPASDIDVNVHPNKLFVKFRDEALLEHLIFSTIKDAVAEKETAKYIDLQTADLQTDVAKSVANSVDNEITKVEVSVKEDHPKEPFSEEITIPIINREEISDEEVRTAFDEMRLNAGGFDLSARQYTDITPAFDNGFVNELFTDVIAAEPECEEKEDIPLFDENVFSYRYAGSLFNTYALVECGETVYVIDQHALHERLLYDELIEKSRNAAVIHLLVAEIVTLSHSESVVLEDNLSLLCDMGFDIESFGPLTYRINAVPKPCGELDIQSMIRDILGELSTGVRHDVEYAKDKIARAACKAAVKGGDALTEEQIKGFLKQLNESDGVPHCPHGRPIYTVLTKTQLEKSFKRRV